MSDAFLMPSSNAGSRRALMLTLGLGLPLSGVFLWLSVREADLRAVWQTIDEAHLPLLVATVALVAVMYGLQALRWRRIAGPTVQWQQAFGMLVAGLAVNNVVPGRVGDLLRARWMARASGVPGGRGLATVVLDRGADLIVLAVSLSVCLPLVSHTAWVDRLVIGAGTVVLLFVGGLAAARFYVRRRRATIVDRRLVRRIAHDALRGLSEPIPTNVKVAILGLSVGAWLAWAAAAMLCARSIGVEFGLIEALFLAGVVNLGVAIPSSPGFVGTYQWLMISTLALYGVGREDGLAFAIVFQACWYIPTTVIGGILLALRAPARIRVTAPVVPAREQSASAQA